MPFTWSIRQIATYAALIAALSAVGYGMVLRSQLSAERAETARLERTVATLEAQAAQARDAAAVARNVAQAARERAAEYDRFREAVLRGEDDEIPDWFRTYLCDLGVGVCPPR